MPDDAALRKQLIALLRGGHAHAKFEDTVEGLPIERAGVRPEGAPHSAWELLEHMRLAQHDILQFSQSADWVSPDWPAGYWPASPAPAGEKQWHDSIEAFQKDLAAFEALLKDGDLYKPFPWGDGQNLLREALTIADHNSHHLGQLVLVRRLLGVWPG